MDTMDRRVQGGRIVETQQAERNGVEVGIFSGYLATFEPDEGGVFGVPDRFLPGAFLQSLNVHRRRDDRQIRMKFNHSWDGILLGGFPIESVHEDEIGLFLTGEINLETQLGREVFALVKQGVLVDLSIGYIALRHSMEDDIRVIEEAAIVEGSVVDEPANPSARITAVQKFNAQDVEEFSVREVENALIGSGAFSKQAATILASRMKGDGTTVIGNRLPDEYTQGIAEILKDLREAKRLA